MVAFKAVVDGVAPSEGWKPVLPRDVGPNGEFEIKYMSDLHAVTSGGHDGTYRLSVYIKFEAIFTRGKPAKLERIRFDYRIKRGNKGIYSVGRI